MLLGPDSLIFNAQNIFFFLFFFLILEQMCIKQARMGITRSRILVFVKFTLILKEKTDTQVRLPYLQ